MKGFGIEEKRMKILFLAPAICLLLAMGIFPLIFSLYLTFCSWELSGGAYAQKYPVFIGLQNFIRLVDDYRFWSSLKTTFTFSGIAVILEFLIGFGLALLLDREIRARRFFRVLFLVPMMMTPVTVGYTWRMLYHPEQGPLNYFLRSLGLSPVTWIGDVRMALYSVILIDIWQWTPFMILVLLAGLQSLPVEPYEAAVIDGASPLQIFRHITLPMLTPVIFLVNLLRLVDAFKIFDAIYVTTAGGPGISTEVTTLYVQVLGLRSLSLGYASTVAYGFLIFIIVFVTLFVRYMRKRVTLL